MTKPRASTNVILTVRLGGPSGSLLTQRCLRPPVEVDNHGCVAGKYGDKRENPGQCIPVDVVDVQKFHPVRIGVERFKEAFVCDHHLQMRVCLQSVHETAWNGADQS